MITLDSIKDYIHGLNQREILRILAAYLLLFVCALGFLLYHHIDALAAVEQKIKQLNKAREQVQLILTEYDYTKNKKSEVDTLLAKDKNFYIQKYCQETLSSLHLVTQAPLNLTTEPWPNGYIEESVQINIAKITMKQVCEFLQALQENHLVFVKNLDMVKGVGEKKISVNMVVATLKPIIETITSIK